MDQTIPAAVIDVKFTGVKQKILELLGNGIGPQACADTVGVDCSYVTQLLSQNDFARAVVQLRFDRLQKASALDRKYEDLELDLVDKLRELMPYMVRTGEILAAIRVINSTKRRGAGIIPSGPSQVTVVNLILPVKLVQRFRVNEQNQVIEVGEQTLATIASNVLLKQVEGETLDAKELQNERSGKQEYLPLQKSA